MPPLVCDESRELAREDAGNDRTVFHPKKPGDAERVYPVDGESAGTVGADKTEE